MLAVMVLVECLCLVQEVQAVETAASFDSVLVPQLLVEAA